MDATRRPRTIAGRLLLRQATIIVLTFVVLGVALTAMVDGEGLGVGILLVVVAATLIGVSALTTRAVLRPLTSMATAFERGALPADSPTGPAELRALNTALRAMADRIDVETREASAAQRTQGQVLSSMEEGVLLAAPDGTLTFRNPAAERHLGATPMSVSNLLPLPLRNVMRTASEDHATISVDVDVGTPARWLRGSAIPVDDDGSVLLVLRDVTEARRIDTIRRDFVENASHELKTPAASIRAAAETLRTATDDDPAVVARFAEQLEREAIRLSRIVSDLLDLSRLESGTEGEDSAPMDEIVADEVERWLDEPIPLHAETVPVSVRASRRDISLLVRNLVDNAMHYTPPGGRVDVTLSREGGEAVLTVADTGTGIPSRDLPRIFERFYRVDRARSRETGGTGLGLSIVKHVVENAGGTVDVRSELGRGTDVEVRLPIA